MRRFLFCRDIWIICQIVGLSFYAEHLDKFATCKIDSDVTGYELLGAEVLLYFTVAGANMSARVDSDTPARYGDHIELAFDPHKIHVFDKETELTITN